MGGITESMCVYVLERTLYCGFSKRDDDLNGCCQEALVCVCLLNVGNLGPISGAIERPSGDETRPGNKHGKPIRGDGRPS